LFAGAARPAAAAAASVSPSTPGEAGLPDELPPPPPLIVKVVEGKDFPCSNPHDVESSYCEVRIGKQKRTTSVFIGSADHPKWSDMLEFDMREVSDADTILVTALVKGTLGPKQIGQVNIPVIQSRDVPLKYATTHYYPFTTGGAKSSKTVNPLQLSQIGVLVGMGGEEEKIGKPMVTDVNDPYFYDLQTNEIWQQATEVSEENKEIALRTKKVAEAARQIGTETLQRLEEQGDQINRISDDVDLIHNNMTQAERKLRSIDSVFGSLRNAVTMNQKAKDKTRDRLHARKQAREQRQLEAKQKMKAEQKLRKLGGDGEAAPVPGRKTLAEIDELKDAGVTQEDLDTEKKFYRNVEEIDHTVDEIGLAVQEMKNIAVDMGRELDDHNERLGKLNTKTDKAMNRVTKATAKTKLLRQ